MKHIRIFAVCIFLFGTGSVSAQAEQLRFAVAAEPYPPFAFKTSEGQWRGFEVDLINRLCNRMHTDCKIEEVAWDGIIPALLAKKIDVIFASMSITEERENQISFSLPYYNTPVAVAGLASVNFNLSQDGMKGVIVGVQMATTSAAYMKARFGDTSDIRYYDTQDAANADLLAGRLDLIMADETAVKALAERLDASNAGIVMKGEVPYDPLFGRGIGAGLRREDVGLKARLDAAINAEISDPAYDALSKSYFGISVKPNL